MKGILWVIGARGFLGRHIARAFYADGWQVSGLGRGLWDDSLMWGVRHWIRTEVSKAALDRLLELTGPPQIVFHAAGTSTIAESLSTPEISEADTVGTARTVLGFLAERTPKTLFLYPSSCAVYGERDAQPLREDDPLNPVSPYGIHKLAVESLIRAASLDDGLAAVVIRYFSLYGPGLRKQFLWDFAVRVAAGEDPILLDGTGEETRDFLHIDDATRLALAAAYRLGLTGGRGEVAVVNGGTGQPVSIREVVENLLHSLRATSEVLFSGQVRAGNPLHYLASVEKARAIGFVPEWDSMRGIEAHCRWIAAEVIPNIPDSPATRSHQIDKR